MRFGTIVLMLSFVGCFLSAKAQEASVLPIHPGDHLKFEVKFDGKDADQVKTVALFLADQRGPTPSDQPGFTSAVFTPGFSPSSPDTFQAQIDIPDNVATGDYTLTVIASFGVGEFRYESGKKFPLRTFHIENPRKITPPAISVKEVH